MLVVRGGTVVDAAGRREADVAVEDGEVVAVGPGLDVDAERSIDATDRHVVPGLVDAHVHLVLDGRPDLESVAEEPTPLQSYRASARLRETVRAGVTTVRDLGGPGTLTVDAARAVREGVIAGPRVVAAAENITMTGGHAYRNGREADGVAEARTAAREQLKRGARVLKVMATGGVLTEGAQTGAPELFEDELRAVVDVAEAAGVPVAAHAHGVAGIENAVRAGVDSVEHGTYLDEARADLMADRGTYLVPTTKALVGIDEGGVEGGVPEWAVAKNDDAVGAHRRAFDLAREAGVPIAMGTDAGTPFNFHADAAEELELMVERGLSPERALEAATVEAADLLALDDVGRVAEGYRADLVVLDGDPLADVTAWQRPRAVVADGDVVREDD